MCKSGGGDTPPVFLRLNLLCKSDKIYVGVLCITMRICEESEQRILCSILTAWQRLSLLHIFDTRK